MVKKEKYYIESKKRAKFKIMGIATYRIFFSCEGYTKFQGITFKEYQHYRRLKYLQPVDAMNYLVSLFDFNGTPFTKDDFIFKGERQKPSKEIEDFVNELERRESEEEE